MNKFKLNKGITLVALVITIIVVLILVGVTVYTGTNSAGKARDKKLKSELGIVQHAVLEQYTKYSLTKNENDLKGLKLNESQIQEIESDMNITLNGTYYYLDKLSMESIGIGNVDDVYVVNYSTGEVLNNTVRRTSEGEILYITK